MFLVDTSVWITLLRDRGGAYTSAFRERIGENLIFLSRFSQLELLQGAKNEIEWNLLNDYLSTQIYIECSEETWKKSARIFYDLRRRGTTISSPIDCCIAQLAMENSLILLHRDRDFDKVKKVRPLFKAEFI